LGQVGARVGDQHILGLAAVDGVAEAPAADRLVAVPAVPALRGVARQATPPLPAWSAGAGDHAVPAPLATHRGAPRPNPSGPLAWKHALFARARRRRARLARVLPRPGSVRDSWACSSKARLLLPWGRWASLRSTVSSTMSASPNSPRRRWASSIPLPGRSSS